MRWARLGVKRKFPGHTMYHLIPAVLRLKSRALLSSSTSVQSSAAQQVAVECGSNAYRPSHLLLIE